MTDLSAGETFLDLGSGAGIDVFIAAKKVGAAGRAIGVDMTDPMLSVANENRPIVAATLGFDVAEFRKGFLESIPADDRSVDVVTSNCVVNLSPDKPKVFSEIWRILKDHGRVVIADIVSDRDVPPHLKTNAELWGECTVGALTGEGFVAALEKGGFYGVEVLKKSYWKSIEGHPFYSMTVRGYKFEKTAGCVFRGQRAVYLGPGKAFVDEEGHQFPRGLEVEVCTDTASKLGRRPTRGRSTFSSRTGIDRRETHGTSGEQCCARLLLVGTLSLALGARAARRLPRVRERVERHLEGDLHTRGRGSRERARRRRVGHPVDRGRSRRRGVRPLPSSPRFPERAFWTAGASRARFPPRSPSARSPGCFSPRAPGLPRLHDPRDRRTRSQAPASARRGAGAPLGCPREKVALPLGFSPLLSVAVVAAVFPCSAGPHAARTPIASASNDASSCSPEAPLSAHASTSPYGCRRGAGSG